MFKPRIPFDPFFIIMQICAMQCTFYALYTFIVLVLDFLFKLPFSEEQISNFYVIALSNKYYLISSFAYLLAFSLLGIAYYFIIGKSRNALDFISTTFILHVIFITIHSSFPIRLIWWIISVILVIISTIIAISISLTFEMQSINVDTTVLGQNV